MSQHSDRVRRLVARMLAEKPQTGLESLPGAPEDDLPDYVSAAAEDAREADLALSGLEHVEADRELEEGESQALEAIILPRERPVIDIINDAFRDAPPPWRHLDENPHKQAIAAAIPNIGRVEIPNHPSAPYGGTGFVVGPGLIMTNRHVAETFATGVGDRDIAFIPGRMPGIDLKREIVPSEPIVLRFERMVMVHPFWDCALIKVSGLPAGVEGLMLAGREVEGVNLRDVAIIGYPAQDPRNNVQLQNRIFRGVYQVKRMQPGKLRGYAGIRSYGKTVEALTHDASTLGGNSGSAVVDIATGRIVGLHFAGVYLKANYAVPTWELARDSRVVDVGVNFIDRRADGGPPAWRSHWDALDTDPQNTAPLSLRPRKREAGPERLGEGILGPDWYERIDDAVLADAIARDPEGTRAQLAAVLGETDAEEVMEDLSAEAGEGAHAERPDPGLPEIVYLHGIMGGHLDNQNGVGARIWFNLLAFAGGNIAEKMALQDDGFTSANAHFALKPAGHLRIKYAKAARRWRRKRFVVHEFSYDWRKPVHASADRLHAFIEQLEAEKPGRRFAIVAHSMGGLVSAIYAQRHPGWADRIQRAVFVGSPLGGSYAPLEAALGVYPFFNTLARITRSDDIADLQALAITLPGLIEMLPNPALFDDEADYYRADNWPNGLKPAQRWLDLSRNSKSDTLASPLLTRTSGIVSREFGTVGAVSLADRFFRMGTRTGPGDGTVPIRAAAVTQLAELWQTTGNRHADMMKNAGVIDGVADLLRQGSTDRLQRIAIADIDFNEVLPETEAAEMPDAAREALLRRMEEGRITQSDMDYLLDPVGYEIPQ